MPRVPVTAEDLFNIVGVSDPQFSPNGQWLAFVRTTVDQKDNGYKSAVWLAPTGGGRPKQFTSGDKRDSTPRWSPDGRWLIFLSDRGGEDSETQLYILPTDGGEARQVTSMENGAAAPVWSPDGTAIAFTSRLNLEEMATEDGNPEPPLDPTEIARLADEKAKREEEKIDPRIVNRFAYRAGTSFFDDRTAHLHVVDIEADTGHAMGKPRRLTQDARNYGDPHWMPDGQSLLTVVDRSPDEDDLFYYPDLVRVPLDGSDPVLLTGPETGDENPRPSPDGRWIAYNSLPSTGFTTANAEILLLPAAGGDPRVLTGNLDAHARDPRWLPDSQSICFLVSEHGRIDLRRVSIEGGPIETLFTAEQEMLAYDLSPCADQVGFVASTDRVPQDLYLAPFSAGSQSGQRRLTEVNGQWLAERILGDVQDCWFESPDGTPIQGWIIKPPDFDPAASYPLVLSIHGGPHVMWSRHEPTMWHEWQFLAANGYVVFACNPRGSDGYGRRFRAMLTGQWGQADLPDLLAGLESVISQGYADPDRMAITGGSYGGYMTAWMIGHDDRFKAAVAQRGVYDLATFYSTTDIPRLTEWEFSAAPWEDPQTLWKFSPIAHVKNIHTPLLLIHSENDFRVPIATAEGLFVALRRLKRQVELVRYPRDGHELSRSGEPKHRIDRLQRIAGWFDRHVKGHTDAD